MKHIVGLLAIFVTLAACGGMADAQQAKKVPRIGVLVPGSPSSFSTRTGAFRLGLKELGYAAEHCHRVPICSQEARSAPRLCGRAGPLTTRSFIRSERETVMNFMRGLADGMDFYRDERNKDQVMRFLGEYYRSNALEELEEIRRAYTWLTPGLPIITAKALENVIANDKVLSGMSLNAAEMLDLSFLQRLDEERKAKGVRR